MDSRPAVDVFVSYKREDRERVVPLVESLRAAPLGVWWDADIPGGAPWRADILQHLDAARCVIVVWSEDSVSPAGEFVHEEAARAKQRGTLLPVSIDRVDPPLGFGQVQSLDLIGWSGDAADVRIANVIAAARARVSGGPAPAPYRPKRRVWRVATGVALALSAFSFVADIASLQSSVCAVPGVRRVCATWGLGGVPSRAEEQEWKARPAADCDWLRAFAARHPGGAYADEVARRLEARRTIIDESWKAEDLSERIRVSTGLVSFRNEPQARADAMVRGQEEAAMACKNFNVDAYRLRLARVAADSVRWECTTTSTGTRCGFDAMATCAVDTRQRISQEVCN